MSQSPTRRPRYRCRPQHLFRNALSESTDMTTGTVRVMARTGTEVSVAYLTASRVDALDTARQGSTVAAVPGGIRP